MGSTTIRVSDKTHRLLQEWASTVGAPMSDVVDQALELYRRQHMFAQANAADAALRADPDVSAEWDAESVLSEILDQVMVSAGGLQTLLARWNGRRTIATAPNRHPTSWLAASTGNAPPASPGARYLRDVADTLWLGSALSGHLDMAALDAVATLTPIGEGWRLERRPEASLDELEQALAPLLPGQDDWIAGIGRLYRRCEC